MVNIHPCSGLSLLTNSGSLIVLVWVEASMLDLSWGLHCVSNDVVWLLNHALGVADLLLLERALVNVEVGVVLQIHGCLIAL